MNINDLNELDIEKLKEMNIMLLSKIILNKQIELEECEQELQVSWSRITEKALLNLKANLHEELDCYHEKLNAALNA
jgi:hypothetical protein